MEKYLASYLNERQLGTEKTEKADLLKLIENNVRTSERGRSKTASRFTKENRERDH